eukprot:scaffold15969_cov59-Cylindrotheca_fusiformis.AAC.1
MQTARLGSFASNAMKARRYLGALVVLMTLAEMTTASTRVILWSVLVNGSLDLRMTTLAHLLHFQ